MLFLLAVLIVLNIWHWWPMGSRRPASIQFATQRYSPGDFRILIPGDPDDARKITVQRNLFSAVNKKNLDAKGMSNKTKHGVKPKKKSPWQREREIAKKELDKFRLVGILLRGRTGEAFLLYGDKTFRVNVGDKAGKRFVVDKITADSVYLADPKTKVAGKIYLSGN